MVSLLLTDMGSLNFATLIYEETGIRTKEISMSSTMIVLEVFWRMAESGRSLEDIYQNIQRSFETIVQEQFRTVREAKGNKGSNRYTLLREKVSPLSCISASIRFVDQRRSKLFKMQFIEKETFKKTRWVARKNMRSKPSLAQ